MTTSTIPTAIDGLIAIFAASADLYGVQIFDGQPTTNTDKDCIAVGYVEDGAAVDFTQTPRGLGNLRREEKFTIACTIISWRGSTVAKTVRDRAFALFNACQTAVSTGGTLSSSVIFGEVTQGSVSQFQTDQGAECNVVFTVSAESRI